MSYYCIAIGGTGARCLESLVHLCAMGFGPPRLYILFVDPDEAHANIDRAKILIDQYKTCKESLKFQDSTQLFKTNITYSYDENNKPLYTWTPVKEDKSLCEYFHYHSLPKESQDLCNLLYTEDELDLEWDQGFKGRASVGAPVMAYIKEQVKTEPWLGLIQDIKNVLGGNNDAKLFLFSSIFGATGASGFPTIAEIFRKVSESENWANKDRFKKGGALLLPYFSFNIPPDVEEKEEICARPAHFLLNSQTALSHYSFLWKYASPFDSIYLMGDQTLDAKGRKFGRGGRHQMNATHYIELLAALSSLHFYNTGKGTDRTRLFQYYSGREENYGKINAVDWGDIPFLKFENKRNELIFFVSFALAYISFYLPLIRSEQFEKSRELIPWVVDNFKRGELKLAEVQTELDELKNYLMSFLEWICEINFSTDRELKLLNKAVLSKLFNLEKGHFLLKEIEVKDFDFKNMLSKEMGGYNPVKYAYDDLWKNMCEICMIESGSTSGRFVSLLYDAVKRFCQHNYNLELEEE